MSLHTRVRQNKGFKTSVLLPTILTSLPSPELCLLSHNPLLWVIIPSPCEPLLLPPLGHFGSAALSSAQMGCKLTPTGNESTSIFEVLRHSPSQNCGDKSLKWWSVPQVLETEMLFLPELSCSDITNTQVGISGETVPEGRTSIFIDLIPITLSGEGWF